MSGLRVLMHRDSPRSIGVSVGRHPHCRTWRPIHESLSRNNESGNQGQNNETGGSIMAWGKTPAQKEAVKAFLVTVDGKFDLEASVDKYRAVARQHIAGQTAEQDLIGAC